MHTHVYALNMKNWNYFKVRELYPKMPHVQLIMWKWRVLYCTHNKDVKCEKNFLGMSFFLLQAPIRYYKNIFLYLYFSLIQVSLFH